MKKGSITIYLSLALCVMVSLIFVSMDSARYSCGRAMAALSAEEGLFSLFGEYDRLIYDNYGLLMIDGGYGSDSLNAGALMDEMTYVFDKIIKPDGFMGLSSGDLFRVDVDSRAFTGLVLATDTGGQMLKDQIIEIMKVRAGADVLNGLLDTFKGAEDIMSEAESSGTDPDKIDALKAEYENHKEAAASAAKSTNSETDSENKTEKAELPDDFVDPIENITALKNLGIMLSVIPQGTQISTKNIDKDCLASNRNLAEGIGEMPIKENSATDTFYLAQYIIDYFPNFLSGDEGNGIKYQAEFAVAGKSTDSENLKSVLTRLLLIREALNYLYIMADSSMRAEAEAAAAAICTLFAMPSAIQVAAQALILCWAYAESMQDLKTLLDGGKIPIFKDKASWKLGISQLASLSVDERSDGNSTGLTYENYLCVLLMMKGSDALMSDIIDLLEYNRRIIGNEPDFSFDTCICAMEIQIEGCIDRHKFTLNRSYGYDICT